MRKAYQVRIMMPFLAATLVWATLPAIAAAPPMTAGKIDAVALINKGGDGKQNYTSEALMFVPDVNVGDRATVEIYIPFWQAIPMRATNRSNNPSVKRGSLSDCSIRHGWRPSSPLAILLPPLCGLDLGFFLTTAKGAEIAEEKCKENDFPF